MVQLAQFPRITFDPGVMVGKACIRGTHVTAGMIVGFMANGATAEELVRLYPYLEAEDIRQAAAFAARHSGAEWSECVTQ